MGRKKAKGAFRQGAQPAAHPSTAIEPDIDDGEPFVGQKLLDILEMEAGGSIPSTGKSSQPRTVKSPSSKRESKRLRTQQAQSEILAALTLRPAQQQDQAQMERQAQLYASAMPHNPQFAKPALPEKGNATQNKALWSVHDASWDVRIEQMFLPHGIHGSIYQTATAPNIQPSPSGLQGYGRFQLHPAQIPPPSGTLRFDHGYSSKVHISQEVPLDEVVFKGRPAPQGKADVANERQPKGKEKLKAPLNLPKPKISNHTHALTPPKPTDTYMQQAFLTDLHQLAEPQPLLVVIDLNGTLVHRPNRKNPSSFVSRPFVNEFLEYLFSSFTVMVWSSARLENVLLMCQQLFKGKQPSQLAAVWGRENLGLTKDQYWAKVQVYKRLDQIWNDEQIAKRHPHYEAGGRWDQRNTVLIDDSALKAKAQPFNLIQISEFVGEKSLRNSDILRQVAGYLEVIKHQQDVSAFIAKKPFKANAG